MHEMPAVIRQLDDATGFELALVENIQRADLNPIEEAEGFQRLIAEFGHSQEALGKLVHKSRSHIANLLRLLDLPESVRNMVLDERLSMGHGRALVTARDPEKLAEEVVRLRSEEHKSELKSLMSKSYAVFCWKKKTHSNKRHQQTHTHG